MKTITPIEGFFIKPQKKTSVKIIKNIEGIFTLDHNLGSMSSVSIDTLDDARMYYKNVSCDKPIFIKKIEGNIYISKTLFYNPVNRAFISKQNTYHETIYRWNQVSPNGILLQSLVLNG